MLRRILQIPATQFFNRRVVSSTANNNIVDLRGLNLATAARMLYVNVDMKSLDSRRCKQRFIDDNNRYGVFTSIGFTTTPTEKEFAEIIAKNSYIERLNETYIGIDFQPGIVDVSRYDEINGNPFPADIFPANEVIDFLRDETAIELLQAVLPNETITLHYHIVIADGQFIYRINFQPDKLETYKGHCLKLLFEKGFTKAALAPGKHEDKETTMIYMPYSPQEVINTFNEAPRANLRRGR